MGVSGNSVAGKSYQIFTVSEELLAKVTEAVQAGEKEARSSKNIQSFEVFCHGFRANISLGRIMIVPPAVCSDRENFPTALLHGALVKVFGTGGEEISDLIEKRIGESEFDEYSQADFDSLKESLFVDPQTGEEACLIVFAPNWMNSREYICFHFTKDAEKLKNNLRHQVFSAYYNPAVSSAFNALMTNVNTTKVDVTDVTPKLSYPWLTENPLKEFPRLDKQAAFKKETILLNRKTADDVTKQTLEPQELDVFEALDTALSNSMGVDSGDGAQGEGGFTAPEDKPGVPREASSEAFGGKQAPPFGSKDKDEKKEAAAKKEYEACDKCGKQAEISKELIAGQFLKKVNCKHCGNKKTKAGSKTADVNPLSSHETPFTNVGPGSEAEAEQENSAPAIKESLDDAAEQNEEKATSPIGIPIDENGVPRREGAKEAAKKVSHIDKNGICPGCKKAGKDCACKGCTCKAAATDNPSNRRHDVAHPETLRVDPTRLSSAVSAQFNGGYVQPNHPPQKVQNAARELGSHKQAPHAAFDHAKQIEAGLFGDDPLSKSSNEKWGSGEILTKTKRSNKEVMADYIADVVAGEDEEPVEAMSSKSASARAKKEAHLDKFRPKVAVELDIDSIWDSITEDMGPAPLVEVEELSETNPAPSNTEDQGGWSESTSEGEGEAEAPSTAPRKRDVQDLPEAFRSSEPEEEKEISTGEAEQEETGFENEVTQEEEHHEGSLFTARGSSVDAKYADFVGEIADEIDAEEELPGQRMSCPDCQMLSIQGVPCHEQGCPNHGARWDSASGNWVEQRKCMECGGTVDADDPCCSAEEFQERMEEPETDVVQQECMASDKTAGPYNPEDDAEPDEELQTSDKVNDAGADFSDDEVVSTITHGSERLQKKLDPRRFPGMSNKMQAIVAYLLGNTTGISEMAITSDGIVMAQRSGDIGMNDIIGSYSDLKRNWEKLLSVAGLEPEEMKEAQALFNGITNYQHTASMKKAERTVFPQETTKQTPGAYSYNDMSSKALPIAQPPTSAAGAAPSWVTSSEKTADAADNDYDIDAAADPTSKETGKSDTVECHEDYDAQQSKGAGKKKADTAQNPYNWDENKSAPAEMADFDVKDTTGGDAPPPGQKQGGGVKRMWEDHMEEKESLLATIRPGDRVTILVPAGMGRNGQEWTERTGRAVIISPGHVALNMGGQHGTPGVATAENLVSVRKAKSSADLSGDAAEAKAETVSPDTVDADIQQPTVSVEDAAHKNGADKVALHFMNEYDVDEAVALLGNDPVLGKAVRFLRDFKDEVNSHSDGWSTWRAPVAAAGQLMTLIEAGMSKKRGYGRTTDPSVAIDDNSIKRALAPIKSFMTRRGLEAGMEMPKLAADISGDMSEAKSEIEYNKSDMANEPEATDTVNPEHFASKGTCAECGGKSNLDKNELCSDCRHEEKAASKTAAAYESACGRPYEDEGDRDRHEGQCEECVDINHGQAPREKEASRDDGVPEVDVPSSEDAKQPKSDLSGAAPEAHDEPAQVDSKEAAWGDDQPESVEFDFGAGDLADIVMSEDADEAGN